MGLRVVIFGPGRVGQALGHRLVEHGVQLLGYVGRDPGRTAAAIAWVGGGNVPALGADAHRHAHVVLFAVGDGELAAAVQHALAAAPPRPCSHWLHPHRRHPVAPFADGRTASAAIDGAPAVLVGDAPAQRLLGVLCRRLGLVPVAGQDGNRTLYHAACALAANGSTALWALAEDAFVASGVVAAAAARQLVAALVAAAAAGCARAGPAAALSGPVRRGDAATVATHLQALGAHDGDSHAAYLALAARMTTLARAAGLAPERLAQVLATIAAERARPPTSSP
jgi:predicted short-subunit dehydrogenase-like oxidoreductase (DUF2520 family)